LLFPVPVPVPAQTVLLEEQVALKPIQWQVALKMVKLTQLKKTLRCRTMVKNVLLQVALNTWSMGRWLSPKKARMNVRPKEEEQC